MSSSSSSSSPPPASQAEAQLAAENEKLKGDYAKMSEQGNLLLAQFQKVQADKATLAAEKAALLQKMQRGGAGKLLQMATKFTGQGSVPVDEWIDDMEKHFRFFYVTADEKVDTAVMLLKGHASHWWKTLESKHEDTKDWPEFIAKMRDMFQPVSTVDRARVNLDACAQGGRSVQTYSDQFNQILAHLPNMEADDAKYRYIKSLSQTIRMEVLKQKTHTLQDAIVAAVLAEAYLNPYANRVRTGQYYPAHRAQGGASSAPMEVSNLNAYGDDNAAADEEKYPSESVGSSGSPSDAGDALREMRAMMEEMRAQQKLQQSVSNLFQKGSSGSSGPSGHRRSGTSSSRVPGVTKADYERCRKEGLCLRCKQAGHVARDCSKPVSLKY